MAILRADGLEIAYERAGEGPPLVLVHGAACDGRVWRPQLAALSDEFTVVAWDEPGAGRSSDVPADIGLPDYADALAAVIGALALGPAHVAGLSWGGTVALELYRRRPELVATLVLADSYAGWKGSLPPAEVRARVAGARADGHRAGRRVRPHPPGPVRGGAAARVRRPVGRDGRGRAPAQPLGPDAGDGRGRPARPAAARRGAHPADLGRAGRAVAAGRGAPRSRPRSRGPSSW